MGVELQTARHLRANVDSTYEGAIERELLSRIPDDKSIQQ